MTVHTEIYSNNDESCWPKSIMNTILFTGDGPSFKPVIAAACARGLKKRDIKLDVAVKEQYLHDRQGIDTISELGLAWPEDILSLEKLALFPYDLVVYFTQAFAPPYPALPGNPPVVCWDVPDPFPLQQGQEKLGSWMTLRDRILGLVEDLFGQGYLDALMQVRRNAELTLDNLHEGIIAHDLNRHIFFFNRAAERITGYSRQEILGRDCHDVFPDRFCKDKCAFCDTDLPPVLQERPYPLFMRGKSGETRQIEMSVVPITDFFGSTVGVVASFRDMTREFELAKRLGEIEQFSGIIGQDSAMLELYETIRNLADSNASVLIQGESGTGKELVAAAIHNEGRRANKYFVPVNCGALPENLLEAELFGHVKGAFTGAIRDKKGRFELAHGGTIFLDEIGDISPAMQVKLLRVLQDGIMQRVGSEETTQVDVRVISATHKDLQKEIAASRFREDLYYRLCVVPLQLPPLRERRNDIPLLVEHFLKRFKAEENRSDLTLAPETMDVMLAYGWPGNVRELQNVIRYVLVRCREAIAKPHHLPPNLLQERARYVRVNGPKKKRGKLDRERVQQALVAADGNRVQAAKRLGVSRATLYRFLDKHFLS